MAASCLELHKLVMIVHTCRILAYIAGLYKFIILKVFALLLFCFVIKSHGLALVCVILEGVVLSEN